MTCACDLARLRTSAREHSYVILRLGTFAGDLLRGIFREVTFAREMVIFAQERSLWNYPPAPACQGHQGCGFRISSLLNNQHSCFQLSGYQLLSVKAQIGSRSASPDPENEIRFITKTACF